MALVADLLPDAVVRYGDHSDGIVDLHLPAEPNGTLVVLVHGGFWMQEYDRTHVRPLSRALADLGYLVASPEYRRLEGAARNGAVIADDVESATCRLLEDLLEGLDLAWERCVVVGHSAGGHLALVLASRPVAASVDLVVGLAPVCDLVLADELALDGGVVSRLVTGTRIEALDPMTLLDGPPGPRVVLVHGDRDDRVPIELSRRFVAAHPWSELVELSDVGHFEFLDRRDPAWSALTSLLSG